MEEEEEDEYDGRDGAEREEEGTAGSEAWDEGDSRLEDEEEDEDEGGARGAEPGTNIEGANKTDGAEGQRNAAEEEAPPPVLVNAWSCGESNAISTGSEGEVVVLLNQYQNVYVSGNATIMALMGKARIFGTTLVGGIEAPGGGHLVPVSAVAPCGPFAVEGAAEEGAMVTGKILSQCEVCSSPEHRERLLELLRAVLESGGEARCALLVRGAALTERQADDGEPSMIDAGSGPSALASLQGCSIVTGDPGSLAQPMVIAPEWRRLTDRLLGGIQGEQRVAAAGVKGSGKSSLVRYLCNVMVGRYGKVALLDTDVGQAETGPPGLLSLTVVEAPMLGPPDTHVLPPHTCVFYGETSPEEDPQLFIKGCKKLANAYKSLGSSQESPIPLVVNTCGWVKGLGLELLSDVLDLCDVTHVALCTTGNPKKDLAAPRGQGPLVPGAFDASGSKRAVKRRKKQYEAAFGRLPSPPPGGEGAGGDSWAPQGCEVFALPPLKLTGTRCGVQPTEMRNRLMISYFGGRGMNPLQVASHLAKARPYAVPLTTLHVRFMRSSVPPGQVLNALLGTVVGLCTGGGGTRGGFQGGPLSVTNAPEACKCVGLGIVRAADPSKQALYIITPVDPSLLENVDTLVRGRHEMCVSMLDWYGGDGAPTPYLAAGSLSGAGSVPMKSRSGIMRKGHAGGGG